jgi:hypothetical protein
MNQSPLVTEEEAQSKICCGPVGAIAVLMTIANLEALNLKAKINPPKAPTDVESVNFNVRCVGSTCMAWRWSGFDKDKGSCGLVADKERMLNECV